MLSGGMKRLDLPGIFRFSQKHARLILAATVLLTLVMAYFGARIQVVPDLASLIPETEKNTRLIKKYGSGKVSGRKHTFVEANATGLVIYRGNKLHRITRANIATDAEFLKVAKQVAADANAVIIFLIRTDGFGTYSLANRAARSHGARTGKLPVIGQGHINLKMFDVNR